MATLFSTIFHIDFIRKISAPGSRVPGAPLEEQLWWEVWEIQRKAATDLSDLGSALELEPFYNKGYEVTSSLVPQLFSRYCKIERTPDKSYDSLLWRMSGVSFLAAVCYCVWKYIPSMWPLSLVRLHPILMASLFFQHNPDLFLLPRVPCSMLPNCYFVCWNPLESKPWDPGAFSDLHIQREGIRACLQFELKYMNENLPVRLVSCSW